METTITKKGTAYDVKRFTAAVKALVETDLLSAEQKEELKDLAQTVKENYLDNE